MYIKAQEWRFDLSRKVAGYRKMARSKDDVKYGTAQAKMSEDEALRIRYKHGTPLEGGKIADSEPVNLFSAAQHLADQEHRGGSSEAGRSSIPLCDLIPRKARSC